MLARLSRISAGLSTARQVQTVVCPLSSLVTDCTLYDCFDFVIMSDYGSIEDIKKIRENLLKTEPKDVIFHIL